MPEWTQKQHVGLHRKFLMRKQLLRFALDGPAYVPFIGDGDIAVDLYRTRAIFGADLDKERVATARDRLLGGVYGGMLRVADCNGWPFPDVTRPFAVADFDAYVDPYESFRAFWAESYKLDRLVVFFTDGLRQRVLLSGEWTRPDGVKVQLPDTGYAKMKVWHPYLQAHIWPWFNDVIAPWRMRHKFRYQRDFMVYWGCVIDRGLEGFEGRTAS